MVKRAGFTFIELIFAIVIVSVVVMSLPVISTFLTKSTETNIVQEAIFAASTELNELTTYHWDDNSLDPNSSLAAVINVDNSCEDDNTSTRYHFRPGHILQPYHRKCINDLLLIAADSNISDTASIDDIVQTFKTALEDMSGAGLKATAQGYKDVYKTKISVEHNISTLSNIKINNTTPITSNTNLAKNIKKITVLITSQDDKNLTSLSTYITNIGEVDFYKRSY